MPNLLQSFQGRDIGFLRVVARLWGIELVASDNVKVQIELAMALLDRTLFADTIGSLPADARSALAAIANADGKLTWAVFSRNFGDIREAGPARRDREKIFLNPGSPAEVLYFRALIAKAFFDTQAGAQEFAYVPDDFLELIKNGDPSLIPGSDIEGEREDIKNNNIEISSLEPQSIPLGRPASAREHTHPVASPDRLIDDATTLLAATRMGISLPDTRIPARVVLDFISAAGIIKHSSIEDKRSIGADIEAVRRFLEASRNDARNILIAAWLESETFNELCQIPGLVCEGEWSNRPLPTRKYLLSLINNIPENTWWSLPVFIQSIKEKDPDFQRPAGDYDSWFIKRESDNTYLRGFNNWNEVDGALVRYMIIGPMFWLGLVDVATPEESDVVTAFRTKKGKSSTSVPETARLFVSSGGKIVVPRLLSRLVRYQVARFCEWEEEKEEEYHYRISTFSLKQAAEQGLKVKQLLSLLSRNTASEIPPAFLKALKRWELNGIEATVKNQTILKVNRPEVLEELRESKAGRFLGETLGPVTVVVKPGAQTKVLAALAELGLLAEVGGDE
jgi:hypothetical protein